MAHCRAMWPTAKAICSSAGLSGPLQCHVAHEYIKYDVACVHLVTFARPNRGACLGSLEVHEDLWPGAHESPWESQGLPASPKDSQGVPRTPKDSLGSSGTSKDSKEFPRTLKDFQGLPGNSWGSKNLPASP